MSKQKTALDALIWAQRRVIDAFEEMGKKPEPKKYVPLKMPLIEPLIGIPMYTEQSLKCLTWEHAKGREAIKILKDSTGWSQSSVSFLYKWEKGPPDGQD